MKFYRKAEHAVQAIVDAFEQGTIPKALANVFIKRNDSSPCRAWSWNNQLLVALAGFSDARGFRQWEKVKRHVQKGQKARCNILIPVTISKDRTDDSDDAEPEIRCIGFTSSPVFGLSQTDGKPVEVDDEAEAWLQSLPLRGLAEAWGLEVQSYNGRKTAALGWYRAGQTIALGVENLSTWTHELCHAADDRLGTMQGSDKPDREIVAELAGATLLECLGQEADSDRGGAWAYILAYTQRNRTKALTSCSRLLTRVCNVVALILDEAATLPALDTQKGG